MDALPWGAYQEASEGNTRLEKPSLVPCSKQTKVRYYDVWYEVEQGPQTRFCSFFFSFFLHCASGSSFFPILLNKTGIQIDMNIFFYSVECQHALNWEREREPGLPQRATSNLACNAILWMATERCSVNHVCCTVLLLTLPTTRTFYYGYVRMLKAT